MLPVSCNRPQIRNREIKGARSPQKPKKPIVLAGRSPVAVSVGAWVEGSRELQQHPSAQALLTEQHQKEHSKKNEENLRHFQEVVRKRVAQRALLRNRELLRSYTDPLVIPGSGFPQQLQVCSGPNTKGACVSASWVKHKTSLYPEDVPQQRVEFASGIRLQPTSSQSTQRDPIFDQLPSSHVRQVISHVDQSQLEVFVSRAQPVLWPLNNTEELKRQRQSQFLMHRRLFMNIEREHVRKNEEHKKHLKRTASIKAEKEKARMKEERRLERTCALAEAHQKLEEREQLIQDQLKLGKCADGLPIKRQQDNPKTVTRLIHALRAQLREQVSQETLELSPLCYCGSFWESDPNTCANNCVFHNNPKAYVQALHSAILSWDLQ